MIKKPLHKKVAIIAGSIIGIGASVTYLTQFTLWAQDTNAKNVIKCREKYFVADHRPIYDSISSLQKTVQAASEREKIKDTMNRVMYHLLMRMATRDQKVGAINDFNEEKTFGVR